MNLKNRKWKESLHIPETCKENADSFTDEDERIRKIIVKHFEEFHENSFITLEIPDILAYLEKQKDSVSNAKYIEDVAHAFEDGRKKGIEERQKEQSLRDFIDDFPYSDEQKEQKPAEWSKEDKDYLNAAISFIKKGFGENSIIAQWLESLPERFNLQSKKGMDVTDFCRPIHPDIAKALPDVLDKLLWDDDSEKITDEELEQSMAAVTDFKIFAADLARTFHITYKRDIDWHNFCAGLLMYLEKIKKN